MSSGCRPLPRRSRRRGQPRNECFVATVGSISPAGSWGTTTGNARVSFRVVTDASADVPGDRGRSNVAARGMSITRGQEELVIGVPGWWGSVCAQRLRRRYGPALAIRQRALSATRTASLKPIRPESPRRPTRFQGIPRFRGRRTGNRRPGSAVRRAGRSLLHAEITPFSQLSATTISAGAPTMMLVSPLTNGHRGRYPPSRAIWIIDITKSRWCSG